MPNVVVLDDAWLRDAKRAVEQLRRAADKDRPTILIGGSWYWPNALIEQIEAKTSVGAEAVEQYRCSFGSR